MNDGGALAKRKLDASYLIEKIRAERVVSIKVGDRMVFAARRPTEVEMLALRDQREFGVDKAIDFLVGWDGVQELDVITGGAGHEIEFNADLAREWLNDRLDILLILAPQIIDAYTERAKRLKDAREK